jgi:hypothetical protein
MNTRRTPGRVLSDHAKDQFAQLFAHTFSSHAGSTPRVPRPVQLEFRPVPTDNGVRLDEDQGSLPSRPEPLQHHLEQFVVSSKLRLRLLLFQYCELLAKCQVYQQQFATRSDRLKEQNEQELQRTEHEPVVTELCSPNMKSAVGFATVLDCGDVEGMAVVVEPEPVVANAQAELGRLDVL